ncbi:MAG: hypothetical protein O2890_10800 [Cyanobacteria bacterium]|nr:hypothetical protein [Cyanobacteriota bacterium]MDA0866887.1 hypothetical protein [Cyanobacteriota bacterium]
MNGILTQGWLKTTGLAVGLGLVALGGCDQLATGSLEDIVVTDNYEATAMTTYTWQAEYRPQGVTPDRPREGRIETFGSSYRVNINGQPVAADFGSADEQGLWWPDLPPKPTVDDLEARLKKREVFSAPEINKSVQYTLTFEQGGEQVTVQTEYPVYREAVKGREGGRPLQLTLGREEAYVRRAEMQ